MLDGPSNNLDAAAKKAEILESKGIDLTVIGTEALDVERLASSPLSGFVVSDYCDVHSIDGVVDSLCHGNKSRNF